MGQRYISFLTHMFLCSLSVSIKTNSFLMTGHMVCGISLTCNILSASNFKTHCFNILAKNELELRSLSAATAANSRILASPKGAKGPIVISGAHRFYMSFLICCRLFLCREIIKSKLTKHPERYQAFHMSIYCFPNPTDPAQVRWFGLYNPNLDHEHQRSGHARK